MEKARRYTSHWLIPDQVADDITEFEYWLGTIEFDWFDADIGADAIFARQQLEEARSVLHHD